MQRKDGLPKKQRTDKLPELTVRPESQGYFRIKYGEKWEKLHIYVWELYNGPISRYESGPKKGKRNCDVHHGKMGKKCNCISNLTLLPHGTHSHVTNVGRIRTFEMRSNYSAIRLGKPWTEARRTAQQERRGAPYAKRN